MFRLKRLADLEQEVNLLKQKVKDLEIIEQHNVIREELNTEHIARKVEFKVSSGIRQTIREEIKKHNLNIKCGEVYGNNQSSHVFKNMNDIKNNLIKDRVLQIKRFRQYYVGEVKVNGVTQINGEKWYFFTSENSALEVSEDRILNDWDDIINRLFKWSQKYV